MLFKKILKKGTQVAGKAVKGAVRVAGSSILITCGYVMSLFDVAKGVFRNR